MGSQYVGGLVEPHTSDLAVLPHPTISMAACSADLGLQIASQFEEHSLPTLPMKIGGRTVAFPIILIHSLAWINVAQYCLEHSKGIRVFQGLTSDYFGATIASNTLAGDGLFLMLDADLDTRVLFWTMTAAMFNPAIHPVLAVDEAVSSRALESAGLSALILWAKERSPGAIFHVVMRLALDQWLAAQSLNVTVDATNKIKVVFPTPGTQNAYAVALQHVGDDVLIAWCFMHAQQVLPTVTAIGDDYSMEVWINDHKRVETPSVGATLRGEATQDQRSTVFNVLSGMIDSPLVKNHPEVRKLTTDSGASPLEIVDRIITTADTVTHATTVLLQPVAVPKGADLKKGSDAVLDFEVSTSWVLDNANSIPCPSAPDVSFPNAAELGHGSAACIFVKPSDTPTKQTAWIESLVRGEVTTDTLDIGRGPAYNVTIKVPEKPNVSGKYTVAQLVGNLEAKTAQQSPVYDLIRERIAAAIADTSPGSTDAHSYIITDSTTDPDTGEIVEKGWFIIPTEIAIDMSGIVHTDVNSQLSIDLAVPAGSVCTVVRTTNSTEHTVVYEVSAFDSSVYTGVAPIPDKPYDAFKYVKLAWTTRTSPAQRISGVFELDRWTEYACSQLAAFYKRASTAVNDSQNDVSSGNNDPETVGKTDDDRSWYWILLLLLVASASNNQTNVTVKIDDRPRRSTSSATAPQANDARQDPSQNGGSDVGGGGDTAPEEFDTAMPVEEAGRTGAAANPNRIPSDKPQLRR